MIAPIPRYIHPSVTLPPLWPVPSVYKLLALFGSWCAHHHTTGETSWVVTYDYNPQVF